MQTTAVYCRTAGQAGHVDSLSLISMSAVQAPTGTDNALDTTGHAHSVLESEFVLFSFFLSIFFFFFFNCPCSSCYIYLSCKIIKGG